MAVEPPPTITRVVAAQDPGGNFYVVYVRMPQHLANKFPDRPWGTKITAIGLAEKDVVKFPDYVLVGVEPISDRRVGDSADLFWIFQKLDGPVWTTKSKGQESLVPAKFKRLTTTTRTKQEVTPGTLPSDIAAPIKSSVVEQQEDTGKAVKVNTEEVIDVDGDPLIGQQFDPGGAIIDVSENVVSEGTAADAAFLVAGSTVDAFGDGDAAKVTQTPRKRVVDGDGESTETGWPKKQVKTVGVENLTPQKHRGQTVTKTTVEQVALTVGQVDDIPAPALTVPRNDETTIKHEKVNDWRYQREVTEEIIDENADPLLGKQMIEYGIADTSESLVEEGAALPAIDYYTLSLSQDPLGNGKSVLSTTSIDAFPILEGTEILAPFNIPVQILKQVVPAGTEGSASGNTIIEVRPLDYLRSLQITSVIGFGALPVPETFPKDVRYKFPDVLESITLAIVAVSFTDSVQNSAVDIAFDIKEGASGSYKGYVVRSFHNGPPSFTDGVVWTPVPKGDSFLYAARHTEPYLQTFITRTITGAKSVPATLHKALQVRRADNLFGQDLLYPMLLNVRFASNQTNFLPPTAITDLPPSGTSILIDRNSERVRGNIWVLEKTFLTMP